MKKTTVSRKALLEKVKENLKQHIEDYEEAFESYKLEATKALSKAKKTVLDGIEALIARVNREEKPVPIHIPTVSFADLVTPVSYAKDYEKVVTMLEMSVEDTIELDSEEFSRYVMDDWVWKQRFSETTMLYKGK